jgi:hypothetical protein
MKVIDNQQFGKIPEGAIRRAVDHALDVTFARTPAEGTAGRAFVDAINKIPLATLAIPFPRFLVNSMRFFWQHNPTGLIKLINPVGLATGRGAAEWAKILKGDVSAISRAFMGTMMMGSAWQLRNSEFAGEKWHEVKVGDKTVDIRPFNPFAAYAFVADVIKRSKEDRLGTLTSKDIFMGILSSNLRAGTGLFILDSVLEGITGLRDPQNAIDKLQSLAGETIGGFLTPFQQLKSIVLAFDEDSRVLRDRRALPGIGEILVRVPQADKLLPEFTSATRGGPIELKPELDALKQLTGISVRDAKNPAEAELDRLGFSFQEILPSTGNTRANKLMQEELGPLVEDQLSQLVESSTYQSLSELQKGALVRRKLIQLRRIAKARAQRRDPKLFRELRQSRGSRRERLARLERLREISNLE